ncbi:hypothetical protein SMACR_12839 [Sordaria macrospora]|uniref:Uncharacterized protein n=1 Tax=Sordaria macrospora TaxID=5147 RepID=A0A8S9A2V3_SORMA|nr:hypothetical protein SMACR_12839 [Sordaria macrospora]
MTVAKLIPSSPKCSDNGIYEEPIRDPSR